MEKLTIIPDLEQKGFRDGDYPVAKYNGEVRIGAMPEGTRDGHPTVMIGIDMPNGSVLVIETTLALFLSAGEAFVARHGDPRPPT